MKVCIDCTELLGPPGGVRRATRLLLSALRDYAPEVEVTAVAPCPVVAPPGVRILATGGPTRPFLWRRSRALRGSVEGFDLFHSPVTAFPDLAVPTTATVHELPFVENPRLEGTWRALVSEYWITRALGRCKRLVAPSQATLRQLEVAHPAAAERTTVIPHPAPPAPDHEQKEHDGSILFVGRLDKRKCVEALLAGARRLTGQIRLVGAHKPGARARIERHARRLGVADRVIFLGPVDDARLDELYRKACVVGLVSLSEGFGFPVLEALARGVPVVVAKGTGAAEVGGEAVLAIDPTSAEQVEVALRLAADPAYRREIGVVGPSRALDFPPEDTARAYLQVFRDAVAR